MDNFEAFRQTKESLDKTSPSFCLAKWNQVTLHLGAGLTHSCHHPAPHKIPIEEVEENHTALHNTLHKKLLRKQMMEGQRPVECNYCWRVEDAQTNINENVVQILNLNYYKKRCGN